MILACVRRTTAVFLLGITFATASVSINAKAANSPDGESAIRYNSKNSEEDEKADRKRADKGKQRPQIIEAHIDYQAGSASELTIIGSDLCPQKTQDELQVFLAEMPLGSVSCSMLGNLQDPVDVVTATLTEDLPAGDYQVEIIVNSNDKHQSTQFYLTLGAVGPQGEAGPQGPAGINGVDGAQGLPGEPGLQGLQGLTGEPGPQGIAGEPGLPGAQGVPGASGQDGSTGPAGPTGPSGLALLAGLVCPNNQYLAGFQTSGELLCRTLPTGGGPIADMGDPDFVGSCFNFKNDNEANIVGNDWFDACIKPGASHLRLLVKDASGNTVYDQTATILEPWSEDVITSSAGLNSQHITAAHDRILWFPNSDKMVIMSKHAKSTTGCFSSYANGYGLVVYEPSGNANNGIRLMLMGDEHGMSGGRRSLSGWTPANELTYAQAGNISTCDSLTMSASALPGSAAIFVD